MAASWILGLSLLLGGLARVQAGASQDGGIPAPEDVGAVPADAEKTNSGIAYRVLRAGTGSSRPGATDTVEVHYTGWTTDGKMFDSSVQLGVPATYQLNQVIAGWTEGLQLMVVGEKTRFWIPEELAYQGRAGSPQGMLVFDVELLNFQAGPKPPEVPSDCAAPPESAKTTATGVCYRRLREGSGERCPALDDTVKLHFSAWMSDGTLIQSTRMSPFPGAGVTPMVFPLKNMQLPGFIEGVQLMLPGETMRFWIPQEQAFDGRPGAPEGMLVFDVELIEILVPPPAPADVAAPPAGAAQTESGLAYVRIKPGADPRAPMPSASSRVTMHYTGWTTDGKSFVSSITRGEPATFPLRGVIAGWTEGLQLMHVGETMRFWIPEDLAYKGQPGSPAGMLVFDIELLKIE